MNLFEMTGCAAGTVGAFVGGVVGHSLFGWLGAIGGVPIGAIGGWVIGVGVVAIGFFIGIVTERIDQRQRLRKQFGRYWARNRAKEWEVLVERLTPGHSLTGKVIRQFYYGVFIDTGHGFPALLKIGDSKDGIHVPQATVGVHVSAKVLGHDDKDRFIELTQREDASTKETAQRTEGDTDGRTPRPKG